MTEAEWLACDDPKPMLEWARGKTSERKLRLFAAASFRQLRWLLPEERQLRAIEFLGRMAEGPVPLEERRAATRYARHAIPAWVHTAPEAVDDPHFVALMLYRELVSSTAAVHAVTALAGVADPSSLRTEQANLFREIVGNPFCPSPSLPTELVVWNRGFTQKLATHIYNSGAFDQLPILGDALEDAGCADVDILNHLRGPGPHVRGCWALDLILGRQ